MLNLGEQRNMLAEAGLDDTELMAVSPTGRRMPVSEGERAGFLTLEEQGLYEIHDATSAGVGPLTIAVNVDLAESDLTAVDPEELASALTGRVGGDRLDGAAPPREIGPEDLERRQSVWWYLLVAAFFLFVAETVVSNRLSQRALELD